MAEDTRCEWILKNGQRCSRWKVEGSSFCHKHSLTPEERSLEARKGGLSGRVITGLGRRIQIEKPRHIRKCLVNALNLLKEGEIEPVVANSIGYLCGIIIKNMELLEFEVRLKEIENKLGLKEENESSGGEHEIGKVI